MAGDDIKPFLHRWSVVITAVGVVITAVGVAIAALAINHKSDSGSTTTTSSTPPSGTTPPSTGSSTSVPPTPSSAPMPAPPATNDPKTFSGGTVPMPGFDSAWGVYIPDFGGDWISDPTEADMIIVDPNTGVSTSNNAVLSVTPDQSYATCSAANYNTYNLSWDQVPSRTTLCIRTDDTRVGRVTITWQKNREDKPSNITVSGVIWLPQHP